MILISILIFFLSFHSIVCPDCSELMNCSGHGDCVIDGVCSCYDGYTEVCLWKNRFSNVKNQ